jgi:hypothetical protein
MVVAETEGFPKVGGSLLPEALDGLDPHLRGAGTLNPARKL